MWLVPATNTGSTVVSTPTTTARSMSPQRNICCTRCSVRSATLQEPATLSVWHGSCSPEATVPITLGGVPLSQYSMPSAATPSACARL